MPVPMPMPMQGQPGMSQVAQPQGMTSNPQMFAQFLQQMGAAPPNLQGPGQTPMPGQGVGGQMPPMGPQAGGQMPQMGPGNAGQPPQPGQPPMGAGGPQSMPPQLQQMLMQMIQQKQAQTQGPNRMGQPPQQNRFTPQELGALGRMGDTTVAHLTPGEMTVPPEVQSPKVLATLKSEYHKKGVDPSQFTVGSPNSSVNPQTGVPEYNFWSSALPIALSIGGGIFGGPLGAAAGAGIGNLATGKSLGESLMAAGMSGLGAYGTGALLGEGASAGASAATEGAADSTTQAAGEQAAQQAAGQAAADTAAQGAGTAAAGDAAAGAGANAAGANAAGQTPGSTGVFGSGVKASSLLPGPGGIMSLLNSGADAGGGPVDMKNNGNAPGYVPTAPHTIPIPGMSPSSAASVAGIAPPAQNQGLLAGLVKNGTNSGFNWGNTVGAGLGAYAGQQIAQANANPQQPTGFNTPYKSAADLPSWQQQIGQTGYKGPVPSFNNYNPLTNNPSSYNFFPTGA